MRRLRFAPPVHPALITLLTLALLLPASLALPALPVHAATLTVTSLADDNTAGTLRKAITDAKSGDTITFAPTLTGSLTLSDSLTINKNLTIQGPPMNAVSVNGNGQLRVFTVISGSVATISNLMIAGGNGGINNNGTLTVMNCTIAGNKATANGANDGGGIYNTGTLTITNSTLSSNAAGGNGGGGGVFSTSGAVTVTNSTVSGNTTNGSGGGISIAGDGTATVTNSTVSGNSADTDGGGIAVSSIGTLTLANSTISGNKAKKNGGGIGVAAGPVIARNITVAKNTAATSGGGIYHGGVTLDIGNSLLTGNIAPGGADFQVGLAVTVTNRGNNFIRDDAGAFPKGMSDIIGNQTTVIGDLARNGGPTQTHALLPGSAPVDKGSNALCADPLVGNKDQRDITRPQGAACDIGAFELAATPPAMLPMNPMLPMLPMNPMMPMNPMVPMLPMLPMNPAMMMACAPATPGSAFGFPAFQSQWQGGEAIAPNFWGPTVTAALMEQYQETGGMRLVQYFDKGRMERGVGDVVTNGLLANELITGQMQVGDNAFMARGAANIPVAGDPDNAGPTYAGLGTRATSLFTNTSNRNGTMVTTTVAADGSVTPGATMMGSGPTALSDYDGATQHNVPQAFAQYRNRVGLLTIGLAKSEPFVTTVKVGGVQKQVMVQVFERRVLTYTADNPEAFRVEFGNIGQHYYRWRYCGA